MKVLLIPAWMILKEVWQYMTSKNDCIDFRNYMGEGIIISPHI